MRPQNLSKEKRQSMLTENVGTLISRMAVPTIVAQLITTVYNLVDTYFVSTLGTNATAAVGVNASLSRAITLLGSLIGAGASSYIARLLGAKKHEDANRVISTSIFSGVVLGAVFSIVCLSTINPLVYALGATPDCAAYSVDYASYILYASPVMVGSFILNMCLRSEGSATYSMVGIGSGGHDRHDMEETDKKVWHHSMEVVEGMFFNTKLALPYLLKSKCPRVINITTDAGVAGGWYPNPSFSASRGGMIALTYEMAKELGPKGIPVNTVLTGHIEGDVPEEDILPPDMKQHYLDITPLGRLGKLEDIAGIVNFLASEESSFITGQVIAVNGGSLFGQ